MLESHVLAGVAVAGIALQALELEQSLLVVAESSLRSILMVGLAYATQAAWGTAVPARAALLLAAGGLLSDVADELNLVRGHAPVSHMDAWKQARREELDAKLGKLAELMQAQRENARMDRS